MSSGDVNEIRARRGSALEIDDLSFDGDTSSQQSRRFSAESNLSARLSRHSDDLEVDDLEIDESLSAESDGMADLEELADSLDASADGIQLGEERRLDAEALDNDRKAAEHAAAQAAKRAAEAKAAANPAATVPEAAAEQARPDAAEAASYRWGGQRARPRRGIEGAPKRGETYLKPPGSCKTKWPKLGISVEVECCEDCSIYILDVCEQVQIAECRNCRVVVGPCVGSAFVLDSARERPQPSHKCYTSTWAVPYTMQHARPV